MSIENIIPGCRNYDSARGLCRVMHEKSAEKPDLAQKTQVTPPGEIEGPGIFTIEGLICLAAGIPDQQKSCSHFVVRTAQDDIDDFNF